MVTVIPGFTLFGILNLNSFFPGGTLELGEEEEEDDDDDEELAPGASSASTAIAFITSQPTASSTCLARDALKPISTHVRTASSCLELPALPPPLPPPMFDEEDEDEDGGGGGTNDDPPLKDLERELLEEAFEDDKLG